MIKTFEMEYDSKVVQEEMEVDYIVLFGAYYNEHPAEHYKYKKSIHQVYKTAEQAKEMAAEHTNARVWEVAHAIDSGDIVFVTEVK